VCREIHRLTKANYASASPLGQRETLSKLWMEARVAAA
jgi:hypothetical protein